MEKLPKKMIMLLKEYADKSLIADDFFIYAAVHIASKEMFYYKLEPFITQEGMTKIECTPNNGSIDITLPKEPIAIEEWQALVHTNDLITAYNLHILRSILKAFYLARPFEEEYDPVKETLRKNSTNNPFIENILAEDPSFKEILPNKRCANIDSIISVITGIRKIPFQDKPALLDYYNYLIISAYLSGYTATDQTIISPIELLAYSLREKNSSALTKEQITQDALYLASTRSTVECMYYGLPISYNQYEAFARIRKRTNFGQKHAN